MERHEDYYTYVELPENLQHTPADIELVGVTVSRFEFSLIPIVPIANGELFDQDNPNQNPLTDSHGNMLEVPVHMTGAIPASESISDSGIDTNDYKHPEWTGTGDGRIVGHLQEEPETKGPGGHSARRPRHYRTPASQEHHVATIHRAT